ncbi:IS110 family transposase [Tyzzerella sp. OttesenSCG-928-J15]|nr:IS110 family transposase [Tyzzerella sp. OttesenSCG-928-J15]
MNAVGIDVSKGKSMVAVARPFGEVVVTPYEVRHTVGELRALARSLQSLNGETRVVLEHTGRYYEPVVRILHDAGIFVCAVNPLLIKEYGNNSIRRIKTDKADALKIARYGLDNWAELREHTPVEAIRKQLKTMNRQYSLYVKNKTAFKNNLIALLDQTYPGANTYFDSPVREDGSQKWVDFVATFWHVDCVRGTGINAFTERCRKWCKRHGYNFNATKFAAIYEDSRELVPILPKNDSAKVLVQAAIEQLNAISRTVEVIRAEMRRLAEQLPEYPVVMDMFGVGPSLGPQLMAEIGDVRRFKHRGSLTAFAGVDPMPNQSGSVERKSNPSSKRGSPYLRKTLFIVMTVLLQQAPAGEPVYDFLHKKRSEGKPYYVYMTAGANKFLRIYYGCVKEYLASIDKIQMS